MNQIFQIWYLNTLGDTKLVIWLITSWKPNQLWTKVSYYLTLLKQYDYPNKCHDVDKNVISILQGNKWTSSSSIYIS
jgi:hypothetical protein